MNPYSVHQRNTADVNAFLIKEKQKMEISHYTATNPFSHSISQYIPYWVNKLHSRLVISFLCTRIAASASFIKKLETQRWVYDFVRFEHMAKGTWATHPLSCYETCLQQGTEGNSPPVRHLFINAAIIPQQPYLNRFVTFFPEIKYNTESLKYL